MSTNRLNLNFKLETRPERVKYIETYLENLPFSPTEDELEMMGNYILWGKDPETGLNGRQEGIELETRFKTWDARQVESLDELIETPGFSEATIRPKEEAPTKNIKETFSRSRAREAAPPHLLPVFEDLWKEIDSIELRLNFYELAHGKRIAPPREALINRFTPDQIQSIKLLGEKTKQYEYLKLRHKLVELRREQYTLKDEYAPTIQPFPTFNYIEYTSPEFGEEIEVLPMGVPFSGAIFYKIFPKDGFPIPEDFSSEELEILSDLLWKKPETTFNKKVFDFRDTDHLYKLFSMWEELLADAEGMEEDSSLRRFLRAAAMYRTLADLDPVLDELFELKLKKKQNQEIAEIINKKYSKNYRANYISTLYCKKCLVKIAEAAKKHREVLENCFFPENFKKCKDCGRVLLLNEDNFVKRKRSSDGFSPRCKKCEKVVRDRSKNK